MSTEKPDEDRQRQHLQKGGRVIYDCPSKAPQDSLHWSGLVKRYGGVAEPLINSHDDLLQAFKGDVDSFDRCGNKENYQTLAKWSCILGYCEALVTHKDAARRHGLFPIPIGALSRLIDEDFLPLLRQTQAQLQLNADTKQEKGESLHRQTARAVANAIWKRAQNKNSSMQDELHANSAYTCLCGEIDGKSIDCFGSALLVVIGMNMLGFETSCLTLSEDHAYESHIEEREDSSANNRSFRLPGNRSTCEVAVPGNTKAAQSKRGKCISETFEQLKRDNISAETSWLYMGKNPVVCDSPGMALAAMVSNVNCDIDKQKPGGSADKPQVVSRALYRMKRDMLWHLHEQYMNNFPFALIELAECEEHLSSERGMEWVDVSDLLGTSKETLVLRNEKLFLDAISIDCEVFGDSQVYPYLYCAHYHRDAGRQDKSQEYRLVESLRLYAEATRVASTYRYDAKDCMQLMKHFTSCASLILKDVLLSSQDDGVNGKDVRLWQRHENAVAAATWLLGFFDNLLWWEESQQSTFVEILGLQNKHSISKLLAPFSVDVRIAAVAKIRSTEEPASRALAVTEDELLHFKGPRSKRLAEGSALVLALAKEKVVIRDNEMALPPADSGGRRKRART